MLNCEGSLNAPGWSKLPVNGFGIRIVPKAHCALDEEPPGAPYGYRGSPDGEPSVGPPGQVDDEMSTPAAGLKPGLCSGAPYVPPEWYWNAGVIESLSCLKFKI